MTSNKLLTPFSLPWAKAYIAAEKSGQLATVGIGGNHDEVTLVSAKKSVGTGPFTRTHYAVKGKEVSWKKYKEYCDAAGICPSCLVPDDERRPANLPFCYKQPASGGLLYYCLDCKGEYSQEGIHRD